MMLTRQLIQAFGLVGAALVSGASAPHSALSPAVVQPNPNLERAGVLSDGILTVTLEAKESAWWLYGSAHSPMAIAAFSEPGKAPLIPGPLVRVPLGTKIRFSVRNSLSSPLTFFVPFAVRGATEQPGGMDSVVVAPGTVGELNAQATVAGNYVYRATTPRGADRRTQMEGILGGALVVDTARAAARPKDRVFVIMATPDSGAIARLDTGRSRGLTKLVTNGYRGIVFTINGRSWPNTERIPATVGDSLHWRVINASVEPHPMHLHGFYYRVDAFSGPDADRLGHPAPGQMVVTQLLSPWAAMSMSWSPTRPGTWIFHCHFAQHNVPDSVTAAPDDPYMRAMVGLILGVDVADRPGVRATGDRKPVRHLRLVAIVDSQATIRFDGPSGPTTAPSMRFVPEEQGRRIDTKRAFSSELDLMRGEPVSIMIVNHLPKPTSVHWHGIEIEDSYMDGVPGVSGAGARLTPEIAPGDSFEARFTPPRSGTFIYHTHVDEPHEERDGLEGALIVRDPGASPSPDEHIFFWKGLMNGEPNPDTVVFHAGRPARLRLLNLSVWEPAPFFSLTARLDSAFRLNSDTLLVRWRPLAKDGFDLPVAQQTLRPARQVVSIGETYDFQFTPLHPGTLRLELRGSAGAFALVARVPIKVLPNDDKGRERE